MACATFESGLNFLEDMSSNTIDFSKAEKALQSLKSALTPHPANDRERDGAIQRYEYTFEIIWKIVKKVLEKMVSNPKRLALFLGTWPKLDGSLSQNSGSAF